MRGVDWAENIDALSIKELKALARQSVDVAGCLDKPDLKQRLRVASVSARRASFRRSQANSPPPPPPSPRPGGSGAAANEQGDEDSGGGGGSGGGDGSDQPFSPDKIFGAGMARIDFGDEFAERVNMYPREAGGGLVLNLRTFAVDVGTADSALALPGLMSYEFAVANAEDCWNGFLAAVQGFQAGLALNLIGVIVVVPTTVAVGTTQLVSGSTTPGDAGGVARACTGTRWRRTGCPSPPTTSPRRRSGCGSSTSARPAPGLRGRRHRAGRGPRGGRGHALLRHAGRLNRRDAEQIEKACQRRAGAHPDRPGGRAAHERFKPCPTPTRSCRSRTRASATTRAAPRPSTRRRAGRRRSPVALHYDVRGAGLRALRGHAHGHADLQPLRPDTDLTGNGCRAAARAGGGTGAAARRPPAGVRSWRLVPRRIGDGLGDGLGDGGRRAPTSVRRSGARRRAFRGRHGRGAGLDLQQHGAALHSTSPMDVVTAHVAACKGCCRNIAMRCSDLHRGRDPVAEGDPEVATHGNQMEEAEKEEANTIMMSALTGPSRT